MLNFDCLKEIKNTEFVEFANKYITENLELEKVDYKEHISFMLIQNIEKGLKELCGNKNIDFSIIQQLFIIVNNYNMKQDDFNVMLNLKCFDGFNVYRKIAIYNMECSIRNDKCKIITFPKFELIENVNECNMYDYILYIVSLEKKDFVDNLRMENQNYMRKIERNNELISKIIKLNY